MLTPFPDNLDKEEEHIYLKACWNIFDLVISSIKVVLLLICSILLYALFGDQFDFNFNKPSKSQQESATSLQSVQEEDWDRVENGIHLRTGLVYDPQFDIIRANCTACHSGKLVAQNRATREGWNR